MIDRTMSRLSAFAGTALLVGTGLLAVATPALATYTNCTDPLVGPTVGPYALITTTIAPTKGTLSVVGTYPKDNYVKYDVTLTQYRNDPNHFDPVVFKASTSVLDGGGAPVGGQAATFLASSLPAGGVCSLNAAQDEVTCTFHDVADSTVAPNPAPPPKTFSLVVKTPTAGEKIKLLSQTLFNESYHSNCKFEAPLTTLTALSNPALTPSVIDTYLPVAGAVNTGTTGGAATCAQPWVTIAKVPASAQVGVTLIPDDTQYPGTFGNFTKLQIPGALYGWGPNPADQIRWYSPGAASKLLVITLRRDVCTIDGHGPIADALKILKEKIFYRADNSLSYTQLLSCFVTSGPTPGVPCIAHRKVYTKFNLPPVSDPNRLQYLGDHEWVIYAHDNGRYWN